MIMHKKHQMNLCNFTVLHFLKEENIIKGKELLANYCKAQGINLYELIKPEYTDTCKKKYGFKDWDSVLAAVGHGLSLIHI